MSIVALLLIFYIIKPEVIGIVLVTLLSALSIFSLFKNNRNYFFLTTILLIVIVLSLSALKDFFILLFELMILIYLLEIGNILLGNYDSYNKKLIKGSIKFKITALNKIMLFSSLLLIFYTLIMYSSLSIVVSYIEVTTSLVLSVMFILILAVESY